MDANITLILPLQSHKAEILAAIASSNRIIIKSPTGTGKSTYIPFCLLEHFKNSTGKIIILEPRRLAAAGLARRVSQLTGEPLGKTAGFRFRGESSIGPDTRIIFETYGWFTQNLQNDAAVTGTDCVILDEFHERHLDMDFTLAWLKLLQDRKKAPFKIIVMSATLEEKPLRKYLEGSTALNIPGRQYPVAIAYRSPVRNEPVWEQADKAFRKLVSDGLSGSILVFMPGRFEIEKTMEQLGPWCRQLKWTLQALHGGMQFREQAEVLRPQSETMNRVIVTTNVAESSITVPGVTAVIDSGLARVAGYDADRETNTLYLKKISLSSADQRSGRAGRLGPGKCIRLWSADSEISMLPAETPEILKLDLARMQLSLYCLMEKILEPAGVSGDPIVSWLNEPDTERWKYGRQMLERIGALDREGNLIHAARKIIRFPLHPRIGTILSEASDLGLGRRAAAMAAAMESDTRQKISGDIYDLSADLMGSHRLSWPKDTLDTFNQLNSLIKTDNTGRHDNVSDSRGILTRICLKAFGDKIGIRQGEGPAYLFPGGRSGLLPAPSPGTPLPPCIIAPVLHETGGGGRSRKRNIALWLECTADMVEQVFPEECAWHTSCIWDDKTRRASPQKQLVYLGLPLKSLPAEEGECDPAVIEELLAEKLASGELQLKPLDDKMEQLVNRLRLLSRVFPEYGIPKMDNEDWLLIYGEICRGKRSAAALEKADPAKAIRHYAGNSALETVEKMLPLSTPLKSGRTARYTYLPDGTVELSARLGDFIGMQGAHSLCRGKVKVLYNILAPNYRTVQKTWDLTGFWENTYPEVKKELKRRYPKHPWP